MPRRKIPSPLEAFVGTDWSEHFVYSRSRYPSNSSCFLKEGERKFYVLGSWEALRGQARSFDNCEMLVSILALVQRAGIKNKGWSSGSPWNASQDVDFFPIEDGGFRAISGDYFVSQPGERPGAHIIGPEALRWVCRGLGITPPAPFRWEKKQKPAASAPAPSAAPAESQPLPAPASGEAASEALPITQGEAPAVPLFSPATEKFLADPTDENFLKAFGFSSMEEAELFARGARLISSDLQDIDLGSEDLREHDADDAGSSGPRSSA